MKKSIVFLGALTATCLVATSSVNAATVVLSITNSGFETDTPIASGATGWTTANSVGWTVSTSNEGSTGQGPSDQFFAMNRSAAGAGFVSALSSIRQSIDLSAWATGIDLGTATTDVSFWRIDEDSNDSSYAELRFFDASVAQIGSTVSTGDLGQTSNDTWTQTTISGGGVAVPTGTRSMEIRLLGEITGAGSGIQISYDNVSASLDVVPEPSVFALLGLGGLALVFVRRRRHS